MRAGHHRFDFKWKFPPDHLLSLSLTKTVAVKLATPRTGPCFLVDCNVQRR
jgi:hypothetical protein